ncbi:MAG: NAD(P)-dependent oxidoreductase [Armatimonadetes bacterium]|nr:NAD(P)-dependent oxidoreductase [Armatimonadota bacterium]MDW8121684.1 NAD(P)-dependent oxidoreductase [Armatimonadota bacterium]
METNVWKRVPVREAPPEIRATDFREVCKGYTPQEAIREAQRCILCRKPLCALACPIGQDVVGYIRKIGEGDFDGALEIILRDNPFPGVCGRVCPHPCEAMCPRGKKGDPIAIMTLKRAASDFAGDRAFPMPNSSTGKRVAIVGAGPAGLAAAWRLRLLGHFVTIYDRAHQPGGLLLFGIPSFRLPRDVLWEDIERILKLGVELCLGLSLGKQISLAELQEEYDAVLLAVGALKPRWMSIPGEDLEGVWHILDFVRMTHLGTVPDLRGKRVAVVGGGFSALDGVRIALRLGAEAFILYRRDRDQMPASPEEVRHAEEEGAKLYVLTNPIRCIGEKGRLVAVECQRQRLGEPDDSGRPRPVPIPGSEFTIPVDILIEAVSQEVDLSVVPDPLKGRRVIAVDSETLRTPMPKVFAAGDAVTGPLDIVHAIASGKRAAESIHSFLSEQTPTPSPAAAQTGQA